MNLIKKEYHIIISLCCCFAAVCSVGIPFNCAGIFYSSIAEDLGIGIGSVTLYITITSLCSGFAAPFAIKIYQKYNPKPIIIVTAFISFLSYIGISRVSNIWQLYFFALTLGLSISFYGMSSINYFISGWFMKNFGLVVGIAQGCSGLGGALLNGVLSKSLTSYGWRKTYYIIAGITLILMIPSFIFIKRDASEIGLPLYGNTTISQVHQTKTQESPQNMKFSIQLFICCAVAFLCCFVTGFPSHLTNYALSNGFTVEIGASITAACMLGNLVSKFITGFLCDKIGAKRSCFIMMGIALLGFIALLKRPINNPAFLCVSALLAGACYAIHGVGLSSVAKEILEKNAVYLGYSYMQFAAALGSGFAFSIFGFSYDLFGSYSISLIGIIILLSISFFFLTYLYKSCK